MNDYFEFKLYAEYIVPGVIFGIILLIIILSEIYTAVCWLIKESYLKKNGFERYLHSISGFNSKGTYAWKSENKIIFERDAMKHSYKWLKDRCSQKEI